VNLPTPFSLGDSYVYKYIPVATGSPFSVLPSQTNSLPASDVNCFTNSPESVYIFIFVSPGTIPEPKNVNNPFSGLYGFGLTNTQVAVKNYICNFFAIKHTLITEEN